MEFIWVVLAAVIMIGLCAASGEPETLTEQADRLEKEDRRRRRRA